jgi:hypothetical protein
MPALARTIPASSIAKHATAKAGAGSGSRRIGPTIMALGSFLHLPRERYPTLHDPG